MSKSLLNESNFIRSALSKVFRSLDPDDPTTSKDDEVIKKLKKDPEFRRKYQDLEDDTLDLADALRKIHRDLVR